VVLVLTCLWHWY